MDSDARQLRGQQLRALVVSWHEEKEFSEVFEAQAKQIEEGELTLNEAWYATADEILGGYMSAQSQQ
jgi:hypothetical protein